MDLLGSKKKRKAKRAQRHAEIAYLREIRLANERAEANARRSSQAVARRVVRTVGGQQNSIGGAAALDTLADEQVSRLPRARRARVVRFEERDATTLTPAQTALVTIAQSGALRGVDLGLRRIGGMF